MRRFIPLALMGAALVAYFLLGLDRWLSFESLREHRAELAAFTARDPYGAAGLFILLYVSAVALSLPAALILSLAAGLIFGTVNGTVIVMVASTLGAGIVFLVARSALAPLFERRLARAGGLAAVVREIRANAISYLLFLRLAPIVPFWFVNIAAAVAGVPFRVFMATTFIGVLPAAIVLTGVGAGLDTVLMTDAKPDLGILLRGEVAWPLLGLAVLSLVPILARRLRPRRAA